MFGGSSTTSNIIFNLYVVEIQEVKLIVGFLLHFFSDLLNDPGYIALITAGVVILLLILIGVIVGRMRFMQNR